MDGRFNINFEDVNDGDGDFDAIAHRMCEAAFRTLTARNISTMAVGDIGNPKEVLIEIAERWKADAIFVGANRYGGRIERFLLGSVSAAVAARAHCSVEVVRSAIGEQK
jgi:nucleotide-binding universal stress UspA family protein